MKILVCGSAGFIGGALVPALVNAGHEVTGTVHTRDPLPKIPGVKYTEADLTARGCWHTALQCAQPELVYMCAGKTGGSGLDPLHFVTDNALMALQMYRACAEGGVRKIVAMSSVTGYPESNRPVREDEYFDGDPHVAYFAPGHTRRYIERLAAMYPQIETVFLRCAGAYGPGDDFDPKTSHMIGATVRKVAERQDPLTIWGNGAAVRDAVYIDDLVAALVKAAHWNPGAYNLATGFGMSVNEIVSRLCTLARHDPRIAHDLSRPQMIGSRVLDCNKAWAAGWHAHTMMAQGLAKTLAWYERR